jgi:hypothetical protein
MADKHAKPDAAKAAPPAKSGGLMGKFMIAGFMGGVVAVECLLAYLFIPSAEHVAAIAEQNMQKKLPAGIKPEAEANEDSDDAKPEVEIELGEYSITVTQPNSPTALRVDFQLVGTVKETEEAPAKTLFDKNIHRFRDMVLSEIRNLESSDLADPGLTLIKRRILEKSNNLMFGGKPMLKKIVFSQFSYVEQ